MELRSITDDEVPAWRHALAQTFGMDPAGDPQGDERMRALLDLERAFAVLDRGQIVATTAGFDFSVSLPGGSVPMSGLTMVTVRPTHRRRGLLRALIQAHLDAAQRHGDPVSGLWASESTIYGRFGYGLAAESDALSFHSAGAAVAEDRERDRVALVSDEEAAPHLPEVYRQVQSVRPGMFSRSPDWWRYRRLTDRPDLRSGGGPRRYALVWRDDQVTGYLAHRQRLAWDQNLPAGGFEIEELMALDPRAEATLWNYVANIDLFPKVSYSNAPVDSLLPWLLVDRRRAIRRRIESLWLRVDDVPRTLIARTYGADGALTLAVDEAVYRLESDAGAGTCARVEAAPELTLTRAALGAILLGAFAPSLLARAGRLAGSAAALALADRMFASPLAPWCPEIF